MTESEEAATPRFAIFRASEAKAPPPSKSTGAASSTANEGRRQFYEAGGAEGVQITSLFSAPGFSLFYAWFKGGFPLSRHTHDTDCLYYIVAGTIKLGTETLGPGDGFFVGAEVPYAYTPGEEGVEVLEFRTTDDFSTDLLGTAATWKKSVDAVIARRDQWREQGKPSGNP